MLERLIFALSPSPVRTACSTHFSLITGSMPGMPASTNETCAIGLGAEFGRSAGKQLGFGQNLGVNLQADHHFPVTGLALDEVWTELWTGARSCRSPPIGGFMVERRRLLDAPGQRAAPCPHRTPFRSAADPSGRPLSVRPAGTESPGKTGQIHRHGEDVVQIHGYRIGSLFADAEGRTGRGGGQQHVAAFIMPCRNRA